MDFGPFGRFVLVVLYGAMMIGVTWAANAYGRAWLDLNMPRSMWFVIPVLIIGISGCIWAIWHEFNAKRQQRRSQSPD